MLTENEIAIMRGVNHRIGGIMNAASTRDPHWFTKRNLAMIRSGMREELRGLPADITELTTQWLDDEFDPARYPLLTSLCVGIAGGTRWCAVLPKLQHLTMLNHVSIADIPRTIQTLCMGHIDNPSLLPAFTQLRRVEIYLDDNIENTLHILSDTVTDLHVYDYVCYRDFPNDHPIVSRLQRLKLSHLRCGTLRVPRLTLAHCQFDLPLICVPRHTLRIMHRSSHMDYEWLRACEYVQRLVVTYNYILPEIDNVRRELEYTARWLKARNRPMACHELLIGDEFDDVLTARWVDQTRIAFGKRVRREMPDTFW